MRTQIGSAIGEVAAIHRVSWPTTFRAFVNSTRQPTARADARKNSKYRSNGTDKPESAQWS